MTSYPPAGIAPGQIAIPNYFTPIGIASLAMIAIGLLVTWAGYLKRVRWTWFVMLVIVWLWAFPVLILPLVWSGKTSISVTQWLRTMFSATDPGRDLARTAAEATLMFLLMVLALVIPIKDFFWGQAHCGNRSGHIDSCPPASSR